MNDGDTHNGPVEQLEAKFPILVESHGLRQDSGGPGRQRGGLGIESVVRARSNITVNTQIDRVHCAPWGLDGGGAAAGNSVSVRHDGEWREDFPNAKMLTARLGPGDAFAMRSGGGGGFGPAFKRPAEIVMRDVRHGYVSTGSAERDYGVICDPDTLEFDAAETGKRRAGQ